MFTRAYNLLTLENSEQILLTISFHTWIAIPGELMGNNNISQEKSTIAWENGWVRQPRVEHTECSFLQG